MAQISKLVRQRLAQPVAITGMEVHPDADLLTGFVEQSLGASERHQVLQHLAFCADCRHVAAVAAPEVREAQPEVAPVRQATGWRSLALVRWGSAAAMLVIAVGAVMLYRGEDTDLQTRQIAQGNGIQEIHEPAAATSQAPAVAAKESRNASDNASANTTDTVAKQQSSESQPATASRPGAESESKSATIATARKKETVSDGVSGGGKASGIAGNSMAKVAAPALQPAPPVEVSGGLLASTGGSQSGFASGSAPLRGDRVLPGAPGPMNGRAFASETNTAAPSAETTIADAKPKDAAPGQPAAGGFAIQKPSHRVFIGAGQLAGQFSVNGQRSALGKSALFSGESKAAPPSTHTGLHWKVSELGRVQHSADGGATWTPVNVSDGLAFRTVGHNGSQVWAGGDGGVLYHSADDGATWTRVSVTTLERTLKGDIITVDVPTAQSVTLLTSADETWTTVDRGLHWDVR